MLAKLRPAGAEAAAFTAALQAAALRQLDALAPYHALSLIHI